MKHAWIILFLFALSCADKPLKSYYFSEEDYLQEKVYVFQTTGLGPAFKEYIRLEKRGQLLIRNTFRKQGDSFTLFSTSVDSVGKDGIYSISDILYKKDRIVDLNNGSIHLVFPFETSRIVQFDKVYPLEGVMTNIHFTVHLEEPYDHKKYGPVIVTNFEAIAPAGPQSTRYEESTRRLYKQDEGLIDEKVSIGQLELRRKRVATMNKSSFELLLEQTQ